MAGRAVDAGDGIVPLAGRRRPAPWRHDDRERPRRGDRCHRRSGVRVAEPARSSFNRDAASGLVPRSVFDEPW